MATKSPTTNPAVLLTDVKVAALKPPTSGREEYKDLKVTGLRLRIGPTGKKAWIVRARAGDKVINKRLGHYPQMRVAAARIAAEKLLGAIARDGSTEAIDRTFKDLADAWVDKVAKPKNSSWKLQERRLEMHVLPKWGTKKLVDIRRADVRELIEGLEGEVLPNRVLTTIKTVFRYALSRDWIGASPVEGIAKPKADVSRDRVLTMDELARVWRAAGLLGYPFGQYVRALMLTAQRRTEVASMRWESLDLDAATWTLEGEETKSSRAHLVPLSAPVVQTLRDLPRFGPYVFTTNGESHISSYAKLKQQVDKFTAADGGPEMKPWRLHDLRRSVATHLVRLGVLEEVVAKVLNHASQGVTAKVYALHRYEPEKRSALNRWAAELGRATSGGAEGKVIPLHA